MWITLKQSLICSALAHFGFFALLFSSSYAKADCFDTGEIPTLEGYALRDHLSWIEWPNPDITQASIAFETELMGKLAIKEFHPPPW